MKTKFSNIIVAVIVLALASLTCQTISGGVSDEGTPVTEPSPEHAEPPEDAAENTPEARTPDVSLGEEYRSQEGGYSFDTIPGYSVDNIAGLDGMFAPDDAEAGIFFMGAMLRREALTLDGLYDFAIEEIDIGLEDIQFTNKRSITVDGVPGYSVDLRGTNDGENAAGRIIVVLISPEQEFIMVGRAPQDRWDSELDAYFEAVLATVQFFEPTVSGFNFEEEKGIASFSVEDQNKFIGTWNGTYGCGDMEFDDQIVIAKSSDDLGFNITLHATFSNPDNVVGTLTEKNVITVPEQSMGGYPGTASITYLESDTLDYSQTGFGATCVGTGYTKTTD